MNNYTQPYIGNTNYQPYGYQQMYQNNLQNMQPQMPQMPQMAKAPQTDMFARLQGKSVDSLDVVKAMDIPLDGTISYFPLTDGTAIVTKQLQQDGTSKTIVYKPIELENTEKPVEYITPEQLDEKLKKFNDTKLIKDDIKKMQRQIEDIFDDMKYLKDNRNRKD